jgi:hypothetical protein
MLARAQVSRRSLSDLLEGPEARRRNEEVALMELDVAPASAGGFLCEGIAGLRAGATSDCAAASITLETRKRGKASQTRRGASHDRDGRARGSPAEAGATSDCADDKNTMTRTAVDRLLEAWIAGSFVAAYFAFHAPLHFDRGSPELGRITSVVVLAIPVSLIVVPILLEICGRLGWCREAALTPRGRRHVIRVAMIFSLTVALFWPWYSKAFGS